MSGKSSRRTVGSSGSSSSSRKKTAGVGAGARAAGEVVVEVAVVVVVHRQFLGTELGAPEPYIFSPKTPWQEPRKPQKEP